MTKFNFKTPQQNKETKMANEGMKALIGKRMTRSVKFMGEDIKISKLSVNSSLLSGPILCLLEPSISAFVRNFKLI